MYYVLISETTPKARKDYRCIWCNELIPKGLKHVHEVSRYDGLQDHRWHEECIKAARESWHNNDDCEFEPGSNKRGSSEER